MWSIIYNTGTSFPSFRFQRKPCGFLVSGSLRLLFQRSLWLLARQSLLTTLLLLPSLFSQQCQCLVFGGFHYFALAWAFVVDAAEVEDAVDDDAVEFFVVGLVKLLGVGAHGV